eukprot:4585532-Karenia_brevis.AAC.1
MALCVLAGYTVIHIDNDEVIHGYESGEAYCTGPTNKYAHIWRRVWFKARDIGPEMFEPAGVKAHCTEADEQAGRISAIS